MLTERLRHSADDSNDVQSSVMVPAFGVLATMFVAPLVSTRVVPVGRQDWIARLAIGVTGGVVIAITVVLVIGFAVIHSSRRERATLWLRAYEGELQRRWLVSGRARRLWRRRHWARCRRGQTAGSSFPRRHLVVPTCPSSWTEQAHFQRCSWSAQTTGRR
jgi:hypothetical protein